MLASFKTHVLLAFVLAIAIICVQARDYVFENYTGDTQGYIKAAYDLAERGVFTDGHYGALATVTGPNGEGMFFAPVYPAMLAAILQVDPVFHAMVECYVEKTETVDREKCPQDLGLLKTVQIALAILSLFLVWVAGWVVTYRLSVAWIAMGLSALAEAYAYYAGFIMTEAIVFPLFTLASILAVLAWTHKKCVYFVGLGLTLGALALTRPSFAYLFYAAVPTLAVMALLARDWVTSKKIQAFICLVLGYAVIVAPWVARNGTVLGIYDISSGYAPFVLAQRVAYNDMSWSEWCASFIYGLPDFGDSLAKDMFEPQDYELLDYGNPEGYYLVSNKVLWQEVEKGGKIPEGRLDEIIGRDIFGNLGKHTLVTLSLAWRGMWVSKYWGLIAIPLFMGLFISALHRKWTSFLIFSIPPWFMLGFNAFTSVNVVRYNLILVPCLAVAVAVLIMAGIDTLKTRNKATSAS